MKALVSISHGAQGKQTISLLGAGNSEEQVRQRAYTLLHHGHNRYDNEYQGGLLLTCTPNLAEGLQREDYTHYMHVIGELFVNDDGLLDSVVRTEQPTYG